MTVWFITLLLAVLVLFIIYAEVRHGRRSKDFLEAIGPEIDALNKSVRRKYRAKHGRDPTAPFTLMEPDPPKRRGWFRK